MERTHLKDRAGDDRTTVRSGPITIYTSAVHLIQASPVSDWMTLAEAAEYLRYTGPKAGHAAYLWIRRRGIRTARRGKSCLVRRSAIDQFLDTGEAPIITAAKAMAHTPPLERKWPRT